LKPPKKGYIDDSSDELALFFYIGSIIHFFSKSTETSFCIGCNAKIHTNSGALCQNCRNTQKLSIYLNCIQNEQSHLTRYLTCEARCRQCQSNCIVKTAHDLITLSSESNIICTNAECDVFYKRMKFKEELLITDTMLNQFHQSTYHDLTW
jgi:hypothetical protein